MAKQTVTTLIDDIDGSEATDTIVFAYRGVEYTIDLNAKNAAAFDKAIDKFVAAAAREPKRRGAEKATPVARRSDLAEVRAWASGQGWEVSSRGRVAAEILEAYDAAH